MKAYFDPIPCGNSIPHANPHAVSVSFPYLENVIAYEEGDPKLFAQMQSGYPRFFSNKLVQKLLDYTRLKYKIDAALKLIPIVSIQAKLLLENVFEEVFDFIEDAYGNVFLIVKDDEVFLKKYTDFIRNAGLLISSRKAEATLSSYGFITKLFEEEQVSEAEGVFNIKNTLSKAYGATDEQVVLTNCGMNALYAASEALLLSQKELGKTVIVQLGWLYVDTMELIERKKNSKVQLDIFDLNQLEKWLEKNHEKVAVVLTEVVSNPLLSCVDLPALYELCSRFSVKLLVDNTFGTPYCVSVFPYCDVVVESLTKFACGQADLLFGAILTKNEALLLELKDFVIPPFVGEVKRLGFQILNYENRIRKISENTELLYTYLKKHPKVLEIKSIWEETSFDNYSKIKKGNLVPGVLSVVFDGELDTIYDKLNVAKGPSLGTEFILVMPYVYLAHYEYLKSESGLKMLQGLGLNPNLLRISVGVEPIQEIIADFQQALE